MTEWLNSTQLNLQFYFLNAHTTVCHYVISWLYVNSALVLSIILCFHHLSKFHMSFWWSCLSRQILLLLFFPIFRVYLLPSKYIFKACSKSFCSSVVKTWNLHMDFQIVLKVLTEPSALQGTDNLRLLSIQYAIFSMMAKFLETLLCQWNLW